MFRYLFQNHHFKIIISNFCKTDIFQNHYFKYQIIISNIIISKCQSKPSINLPRFYCWTLNFHWILIIHIKKIVNFKLKKINNAMRDIWCLTPIWSSCGSVWFHCLTAFQMSAFENGPFYHIRFKCINLKFYFTQQHFNCIFINILKCTLKWVILYKFFHDHFKIFLKKLYNGKKIKKN